MGRKHRYKLGGECPWTIGWFYENGCARNAACDNCPHEAYEPSDREEKYGSMVVRTLDDLCKHLKTR